MNTRSEYLQIRVTPAQKERLRQLAQEKGESLSAYVLARAIPHGAERFQELLALVRMGEDHRFVLAELNDFLSALPPDEFRSAVASADLTSASPLLQNYVAAMVEQAGFLKGVIPPAWTTRVHPLEDPYFATPLKSLRLHLLRAAPVPYKRRNLFVDSSIGDRV